MAEQSFEELVRKVEHLEEKEKILEQRIKVLESQYSEMRKVLRGGQIGEY